MQTSEPVLMRTAIVYDFDGTLAPGSIQEHSLIPDHLKMKKDEFWRIVKEEAKSNDADEVLVYMRQLIECARKAGNPIARAVLEAHGPKTPLFAGVEQWFDRINAHARERNLELEHYVISSGNEEMIAKTSIAQHFRKVFASRYQYDPQTGHAMWPAVAINYTTKTQFLFRINKGVDNSWDNEAVNRWIPLADRPLPFWRMIYLGDGDTDIPSMKMMRTQGGMSVAVFDPKEWERPAFKTKIFNLIAEDRAHFVVPADYRDGSHLDITLKGILGRIARDHAGYRGGK